MLRITSPESPRDIDTTRILFREYEKWLGLDLCFQGFEAELAGLPGAYSPPQGKLLLAFYDAEPAGCAALRELEPGICEIKRLYVRNSFRGLGIGSALVEAVLTSAREIGYERIRLDTYPAKMSKAVGIYKSHGFVPIPPYYDNPHAGTLFMELPL